ncbi:hypothetical protein K435DRAFT_965827 [Dendrothele bispora CBS 962.96]|uniref:Uncharacterized protein n=1 Tax=Dendrothele bispora (strain CBS 962.96) TaxID=1314807 RepID=A0A4S8M4V9_DENBC|nr:hypothetical protein K435DRAFT_965827 [Dendrothele bispora CBS 962.96]
MISFQSKNFLNSDHQATQRKNGLEDTSYEVDIEDESIGVQVVCLVEDSDGETVQKTFSVGDPILCECDPSSNDADTVFNTENDCEPTGSSTWHSNVSSNIAAATSTSVRATSSIAIASIFTTETSRASFASVPTSIPKTLSRTSLSTLQVSKPSSIATASAISTEVNTPSIFSKDSSHHREFMGVIVGGVLGGTLFALSCILVAFWRQKKDHAGKVEPFRVDDVRYNEHAEHANPVNSEQEPAVIQTNHERQRLRNEIIHRQELTHVSAQESLLNATVEINRGTGSGRSVISAIQRPPTELSDRDATIDVGSNIGSIGSLTAVPARSSLNSVKYKRLSSLRRSLSDSNLNASEPMVMRLSEGMKTSNLDHFQNNELENSNHRLHRPRTRSEFTVPSQGTVAEATPMYHLRSRTEYESANEWLQARIQVLMLENTRLANMIAHRATPPPAYELSSGDRD